MNFQVFKLDLEKAEELEIKLPTYADHRNDIWSNICWIIEKAREFQKSIYFSFIDYAKAFDCVDHNKLWKILKEIRLPDHLACLLRNTETYTWVEKQQLESTMDNGLVQN